MTDLVDPESPSYSKSLRHKPAFVLFLIWLAYCLHGIDRSVLTVLLPKIQQEFGLSDTHLGLLSGAVYAVPYALAGIPLGIIVDRVNRRRLLAALLAIWSLATILVGLSQGLPNLIIMRAIVGAAEAGGPILAISILSDAFPERSRTAALGILYTAPFAGIFGGSLIAGFVSAHFGWRGALLVAGVPGLVLACVILFWLIEPRRRLSTGSTDETERTSLLALLAQLVRAPVARSVSIAIITVNFVFLGITSWIPTFLSRVHGFPMERVGMTTAVVVGLMVGLGNALGGLLFSRWFGADFAKMLKGCSVASLLAAMAGVCSILTEANAVAVSLLALWCLLIVVSTAPAISALIATIAVTARGRILAVLFVSVNLIGAGLGPQLIGFLSDTFGRMGDTHGLVHAMTIVIALSIISSRLFYGAARGIGKAEGEAAGNSVLKGI